MNKTEYKKPFWIWIIIVGIGFLHTIQSGIIMGVGITTLRFLCANKCVDFATKINKNKSWAFIVGYIANVFGLFFYWIYLNSVQRKHLIIKQNIIQGEA